MIDWKKVEDDILKLATGTKQSLACLSMVIGEYIKSLIAEKFKLVASGKVEAGSRNLIFLYEELGNNKCAFHNVSEILKKLDNKNISIYITNESEGK